MAILSAWRPVMVLAAALAGTSAAAESTDRIDFTGEASAGVEYDSNVNVLDLDTNTGEADVALVAELDLGADVALTEKLALQLGYDWSEVRYRDFSDFNLSIHAASGGLKYDAGFLDAGFSLHRVEARLGGDDFLEMRRLSPSLAKLIGERVYLRGAYVRTDKSHRTDAGRSAVNDGFTADAFWFLDGPRRYVALGWQAADENARNDDFDYTGRRLKVLYAQRLDWLGAELKSRVQLEQRVYALRLAQRSLPDTRTTSRSDERLRAALLASVPVKEWLTVESEIEYASNASNLASADFDELSYSVRLAAAF